MSIDAIAVIPREIDLQGEMVDNGWKLSVGPGGGNGLWYRLSDGILLNLGLSINAKDAELYEAVRLWIKTPPSKIWVFPDTSVPKTDSIKSIQEQTKEVGRWIRQSVPERRSILEDLGFTLDEIDAWQREINSGDPKRINDAILLLEKRLEGRDPAMIEALLASFLKQS